MSPRDVRDRFEESSLGEWQATLGRGDDTLLEWTSRRPTTRLSHARFEFHLGMLVAIRAHVREATGREQAEVTTKTVTVRKPAEGGTDLVMVARDCPTHREEAETLVERARR